MAIGARGLVVIDRFVHGRWIRRLGRRSQKSYRPQRGAGWQGRIQRFGLVLLNQRTLAGPAQARSTGSVPGPPRHSARTLKMI